jgi:ATP-dependent helicase HrpB
VTNLPIDAILPDLIAALRDRSNAVLVAPPGAGKTTAVAPTLLAEPWRSGQILLLSPRRLAARAAAERMASLAGEPVGKTIGYATRLDSRQSAETRILVITEGIFVNRIQADPELSGVSAVLFDEVHERSLDSDFGLALAIDAQAALRPDLRIVAMSATLDGARFATLLGDAPVIESEGRAYPIDIRHIGRKAEERIEDAMTSAIRRALSEEDGGILAFLPGVAEIERTAERLASLPSDVSLFRLHGTLDPAEQRAAIAAPAADARKIVLATSIAETSLTLDGVRIVVDSGLARRPRYDPAAGMTRLVTERASQAAVTQRAGRAGRQTPGVVYRLWEAGATAGLPRFDPPEILEADLTGLTLDCAIWGVSDPTPLRWIDPPPVPALSEARKRLIDLGAMDADGRPTAHGRAIAKLPLPPRLAHMMVAAVEHGWLVQASDAAVLLSERGLGGNDADLDLRRDRWTNERGKRAESARKLGERWRKLIPLLAREGSGMGSEPPERSLRSPPTPSPSLAGRGGLGPALALAYPDRIAKRRSSDGADWISVGGRGFRLDSASPLARSEWLAVAETQGVAAGARILSAAPIDFAEIEALYGSRIETRRDLRFDPATGGVTATRARRLGAITLAQGQDDSPPADAIADALLQGVRDHGLELLPWSESALMLRQRAAFARLHGAGADVSDETLLAHLDDWLAPLLTKRRRLGDIDPGALTQAIEALAGWPAMEAIRKIAPAEFVSPAGSHHAIDYGAEGGPAVEVRVQALFGLARHPTVADGQVPLLLRLTSPAGRPIQTTRDLPGFWAGSWAAMAKEMRGRYPRHPWPDDPAGADPTLRTKRTDARRG